MTFLPSGDDVILTEIDMDEPAARVIPGRPPIRIKGLSVELALETRSEFRWDFGAATNLPSADMIAFDDEGEPVNTNAELIFPDEDYETDPEHQRLVRYVTVADEEAWQAVGFGFTPFPAAVITIDDFVFQRPIVEDIEAAVRFLPDRCRIWRANAQWDALTRFGDAVSTMFMTQEEYDTCLPQLVQALRDDVLVHALSPFPDREALLAKLRL